MAAPAVELELVVEFFRGFFFLGFVLGLAAATHGLHTVESTNPIRPFPPMTSFRRLRRGADGLPLGRSAPGNFIDSSFQKKNQSIKNQDDPSLRSARMTSSKILLSANICVEPYVHKNLRSSILKSVFRFDYFDEPFKYHYMKKNSRTANKSAEAVILSKRTA